VSVAEVLVLAAAAANFFLGIVALLHQRDRVVNQIASAFCACLAAWSLSVFILTQPLSQPDAIRWVRYVGYAAILSPVLCLHVTVLLFGGSRRLLLPAYGAAAALLLLNHLGAAVVGVHRVLLASGAHVWYPIAGWLVPVALFYGVAATWAALRTLYAAAKTSTGVRRLRAQYLLVGLIPAAVAVLHDSLALYWDTYPGTTVPVLPIAPLVLAFWAAVLVYTLVRTRLAELGTVLTRGIARSVAIIVVAIPALLILIAAQNTDVGDAPVNLYLMALVVCWSAMAVVPRVHALTERKVDTVLRKGRSYRDPLLDFSRESARILDLPTLIDRVNETVTSALDVVSACVYLPERNGSWRLAGGRGAVPTVRAAVLEPDNELVARLGTGREPLIRDELEGRAELERDDGARRVVRAMSEASIAVAVPLVTPEEFIGAIFLGEKNHDRAFSSEDVEVLTILGNQLATALHNARLYSDLERSREMIQRSDRLSAIGTMAAGLAHEIRNPLVSIRTFTQLLPERLEDEEFRNQFLDLTLSEVDRICALINELLTFARPAPGELQPTDFNESIERICLLLDSQARNRGVRLVQKLATNLPLVTADEDQIKQVVMNVVLNAIQSCDGDGVVRLASYPNAEGPRPMVCIEVSDNGRGIPKDLLGQIFDPFFTTRRDGTGLGLSIAHQIVTRHGGFLDVVSAVGEGTSFYINLPVQPPAMERAEAPVYESEDLRLHG
jgi:signal transduction histidine kinase